MDLLSLMSISILNWVFVILPLFSNLLYCYAKTTDKWIKINRGMQTNEYSFSI